ncbi:hypothetical protein F5Y08DRAFT_349346 [Xylaria arbuscula]|nr:hypothetical protein F5Y08DRAFT_349346 [Xylaria arbuscula]
MANSTHGRRGGERKRRKHRITTTATTILPPALLEEYLETSVRKIVLIRRAVVAELRALEDRVRRLAVDVRRLGPLDPLQTVTACGGSCSSSRLRDALSCAGKAIVEMLRVLDFEGVAGDGAGGVSRRDLLSVFVGAVEFVRDAGNVLGVCERGVRGLEVGARREGGRDRGALGDICAALDQFPWGGLKGRVKGM